MDEIRNGFVRPGWSAPSRVGACMTTREGGCSAPPFDSLNLSANVGDDADCVAQNRRRLRERLHLPAEPLWLEQQHGARVVIAEQVAGQPPLVRRADAAERVAGQRLPHRADAAERIVGQLPRHRTDVTEQVAGQPPHRADAAVSFEAGQVCVVTVADCLPVLFCDRSARCVGATHAGWRGLADGVLEATVAALGCPPAELLAWLGPAIGPHAFQVGDEVRERFVRQDEDCALAFLPDNTGAWMADLCQLARLRLRRLGVAEITGGHHCTWHDERHFFSHRRDRRSGRMAALIWLRHGDGA
ncbi:MAG: peptidoglycan editing factor PgeF [Gammaproteobacteria bacterium]|nr:peptidoglycan editing factor PgeF [Gammaproteobacteria bacterium]